jgi:hypothetical protein
MSEDAEPGIDPFSVHERFANRLASVRPTARARPESILPLAPLDVSVDKLMDLDALEAHASFEGMIRSPRTKEEGELSGEISDALTECKPQFHLRNLNRVERFADPEEPLGFETVTTESGLPAETSDAPDPMARLKPVLLDGTSIEAVRELRAEHDVLFRQTAWNEHFSREIKDDATGPLWKSAPPLGEEEQE